MKTAGLFALRGATTLMLCVLAAPLIGQPARLPNPDMWTLIGPTRTVVDPPSNFATNETTGRVSAIAVASDGSLYIGAAAGGIWKRSGSSWMPLTDFQPALTTGAIAIDPNHPNVIYVGTGERSALPSYSGAGILKSTDGGTTWTNIVGPFETHIENANNGWGGENMFGSRFLALAVSPNNSEVLLAAVEMSRFGLSDSGIYRSIDGGLNWTLVQGGDLGTAVLFDPHDGNTAYAALGSLLYSSAKGIYKSTDAGAHWVRVNGTPPNVLPTSNQANIRLAIAPSNPQILYAGIADSANLGHLLGLYKTVDGGNNWVRLNAAPEYCLEFCSDLNQIAIDPADENVVVLGGSTTPVYRTIDGGVTWQQIPGIAPTILHVDTRAFAFTADGTTLYIGNDGGVAFSTTFRTAGTWSFLNDNLAITQFYPGFDRDSLGRVFARTQDNDSQIFNGSLLWNFLPAGEGSHILYDESTRSAYIPGWTMPWLGGSAWNAFPSATGILWSEGTAVLPPLTIDRSHPAVQYTGTNRVYRTDNSQGSWTPISPTLANTFGSVSAITIADYNPNVVCAGTTDGRFWCTFNADAGAASTWTELSAGLPQRYLTQIAIRSSGFSTQFVTAFSGFNIDGEEAGHVFSSIDFGRHWTDASGNLPNTPVNDIIIDDDAYPSKMYVAADAGVYRTIDGGATWAPLANGLPHTIASALLLDRPNRILYAATMGRSMWRLAVPVVDTHAAIALDPWRVHYRIPFGDPAPHVQKLAVRNAAASTTQVLNLSWTATPSTAVGAGWLSATPNNGARDQVLDIAVNAQGLRPGFYNGTVRIDAKGASNAPQDLTVLLEVENAPPVANAGPDLTTDATSPSGALVKLDGSQSYDPDGDSLQFAWAGPFGKAAGSTPTVQIPIGTYTATLTVTDSARLTSAANVNITVFSPKQMMLNLIVSVANLNFQQSSELLQSAMIALENGQSIAACQKVEAFQNQVRAQSGKQLTAAEAVGLITSSNHILGALACQ